MGQYSTVVSLATENRSCVYTSELLVSNIPFLYVTPFFWSQYDLLSLDSCCCVAAPQTPYGQEKWTQPTLQECTPRPLCGAVWPTHQWDFSIYISVVLLNKTQTLILTHSPHILLSPRALLSPSLNKMSPAIKFNRDIDSSEWCYNRGDARGHRIMSMRSLIFAVEHRQSRFSAGVLRNSTWIC